MTPLPRSGHAPGHVRDCFLSAINAWLQWNERGQEPTVEFEIDYEPRPITLSKACGLVWDCTDILSRDDVDLLEGAGLEMKSQTYAAAARALLGRLKLIQMRSGLL